LGLNDIIDRTTPTENKYLKNLDLINIICNYEGNFGISSNLFINLIENGKVYGWGDNTDGTLGLKNLVHVLIPTEIPELENLKIFSQNLSTHCFAN
jgi:hypothetical protein